MKLWQCVTVAAAVLLSTTSVEAKRIMRRASEQKAPHAADAETYRAGVLIDADTGR